MAFFTCKKVAVAVLLYVLTGCNEADHQKNSLPYKDLAAKAGRPGPVATGGANRQKAKGEGMQSGSGIAGFILPGYSILDTASGDLNGDAYADKLLLLKKQGEDTSSDVVDHPEKRPLLVLAGQADGTYKQAARGDNAVLCVDCGGVMGDPYGQLVIKKSYFSVEMSGGSSWRWTRTVTFKYAPNEQNWFLYKDGHSSFHSAEPDKIESKLYTTKDFGKLSFSRFDVYIDQ